MNLFLHSIVLILLMQGIESLLSSSKLFLSQRYNLIIITLSLIKVTQVVHICQFIQSLSKVSNLNRNVTDSLT